MNWLEDHGLIVECEASLLGDATTASFSSDYRYRYTLTRVWDEYAPYATFVMLNPSTADAATDDPTIRRCKSFAHAWGAGGVAVLNLFAWRATSPAELRTADDPVGPVNDRVIAQWLDYVRVGPLVAAWGVHGALHGAGEAVTRLLASNLGTRQRLTCLGVTKDGHPRHPLYIPRGTPVTTFPARDRHGEVAR